MKKLLAMALVALVFVSGAMASGQATKMLIPSWASSQLQTHWSDEVKAGFMYPVSNSMNSMDFTIDSAVCAANKLACTLKLKQTVYNPVIIEKIGLAFGFGMWWKTPSTGNTTWSVSWPCSTLVPIWGQVNTVPVYSADSASAHTYYIVGHANPPVRY